VSDMPRGGGIKVCKQTDHSSVSMTWLILIDVVARSVALCRRCFVNGRLAIWS